MNVDDLDGNDPAWRDQDLSAMLRHQLTVNLRSASDLVAHPQLSAALGALPHDETFGRLLDRCDPPVALLDMVRKFGKAAMTDAQSLVPRQIGAVLYYASILAARRHCQQKISGLDDDALATGIQTVLDWPWVQGFPRGLLEWGAVTLRTGSDGKAV